MNKKLIVSLILLTIAITSVAQVKLFNGKDLSGWKIHGTELWYVEKGELICESGPDKQYGYLVSDKAFTNFELTVDFKQESNGNSGVFFHCSIDGTKIAGWQAEVAPLNMHTGGIYESYGRGWLIQPDADGEKKLKEGEWNTMIVRVEGKKVTTFLNGSQMITLVDDKIGDSNGKIALQIHDGGGVKVRWKNIQLKEL
ncbi:MAG TPA: DUF1080 domain-containing protein [Chryseolinea sp.]|nr:DUF1080 domain-containing protein [Chryseolinea sp.]HPH46697.1 DUF1080 domain-containing protein [Chryseolinea sp.]HPM28797.1 DUF1080 domain-containing protein [Chryseolinea sp.]